MAEKWRGSKKKKTLQKKIIDSLPNRALTNIELYEYAKRKLKIPYFRGVFMRDLLPQIIHKNEAGIVNLDISIGPGTHWVCYYKRRNKINYFDSFGNLRPPKELQKYFKSDNQRESNVIQYNYAKRQHFNSINCGHLCLDFLYKKCVSH